MKRALGQPARTDETATPPQRRWLDSAVAVFVLAEIVWLIIAGYPAATNDDLWWIGPALGVAQKGSLASPPLVSA